MGFRYFQGGGLRNFWGEGVGKFSGGGGGGGGVRNFRGGAEKFRGLRFF